MSTSMSTVSVCESTQKQKTLENQENYRKYVRREKREKSPKTKVNPLTITIKKVPETGLEPAQPLGSRDFKSLVSTISPLGRFLRRQR